MVTKLTIASLYQNILGYKNLPIKSRKTLDPFRINCKTALSCTILSNTGHHLIVHLTSFHNLFEGVKNILTTFAKAVLQFKLKVLIPNSICLESVQDTLCSVCFVKGQYSNHAMCHISFYAILIDLHVFK